VCTVTVQVTINCAERGLLLLRVRDEIRMTMAAYETLYESAIAFRMRKTLSTEQGKLEMTTRIEWLEAQRRSLQVQIQDWKKQCEDIERKASQEREVKEQVRLFFTVSVVKRRKTNHPLSLSVCVRAGMRIEKK
jgi:hypothetical protein